MKLIFWPTYPDLDLSYFEKLIQKNAQELILARKLAEEVSMFSGRPVLTLHNATLGAPSGWGIPDFNFQLKEIYPLWQNKVWYFLKQFKEKLKKNTEILTQIWLKRMVEDKKWNFYLKNRYLQEKYRLLNYFPLLIAILKTNKIFLKKGKLGLVVPFIDKFIRSSLGAKDIEYFKLFLKFIFSEVPETIVLFFDETTHPNGPTLKLAITTLKKDIQWIKGLGVYGKGETVNSETIVKLIPKYRVFFISLLSDKDRPYSWWEIRLYYPKGYHPAWRDGLFQLFSGTQVSFLTQSEKREEIITDKGPMLLGIYFRFRLKQLSYTPISSDPFWCFYEALANLT